MVAADQESGSGLAAWFWLGISRRCGQDAAWAAAFWDWRVQFHDGHSHGWQIGAGCWSPP